MKKYVAIKLDGWYVAERATDGRLVLPANPHRCATKDEAQFDADYLTGLHQKIDLEKGKKSTG